MRTFSILVDIDQNILFADAICSRPTFTDI